jgi:ribosomal protein L21
VQFGEVLLVGGDQPVLGAPTVAGASVAAEVLQHKRGPKAISFKKALGNATEQCGKFGRADCGEIKQVPSLHGLAL